jgi:hypothetical protein
MVAVPGLSSVRLKAARLDASIVSVVVKMPPMVGKVSSPVAIQ